MKYYVVKYSFIFIALYLLAPSQSVLAQSITLRLLHINDTYEIVTEDQPNALASLMTVLQQEREGIPHHLTTFGGGLISPSVLSHLTKGQHMIELMNILELDVATLGNHEFDYGEQVLIERIKESDFVWLASNVVRCVRQPLEGTKRHIIHEVGAFKIGFFSLLTPQTRYLSSPSDAVDFLPPLEVARQQVRELTSQGADVLVALTHQAFDEDLKLARSVEGIDLILGGYGGGYHSFPLSFYQNDVLIVKSDVNGRYLVRIDVQISKGEEGVVVSPSWSFLPTNATKPNPEVANVLETYRNFLDHELNQPIGTTTVVLDTREETIRTGESNFANLVADVIRGSVGADIALINGGNINGNHLYPAGTVLTYKDILTEFPYQNSIVKLEVKGSDIRTALENGVSFIEEESGRFPHVSGIQFVFDPKALPGSRIVQVFVGGDPLDDNKTYSLATSDFLRRGGDEYTMFKDIPEHTTMGMFIHTQVIEFIKKHGTISPRVSNRIVRVTE